MSGTGEDAATLDDSTCVHIVGNYLGKPVKCGLPRSLHGEQTVTLRHPFTEQSGSDARVVSEYPTGSAK